MQRKPEPRVIRQRDAGHYLGMDDNRFNEEVRPHVTEIPIGKQGIGMTVLTWTHGSKNIRAATGVPANGKELRSRGTQENPWAH